MNERGSLADITALAKRRGFIFQSSEIYGGLAGFFDYGPMGAVLKKNVRDAWWRRNVLLRDDVVAFDASIIMHPEVWKASGHVNEFHDRMVDCKTCKHRFRADHLASLERCPDCGTAGSLTEPRNFNLMLQTFVGPAEDSASRTYLRPETAQGIFVNFKNIAQSARKRPPFGIAQIGKAFRNEITPGNLTFRTREFEQAEMEYFVSPDADPMQTYRDWIEIRRQWYAEYGVSAERLRFHELASDECPHYAVACTDVEYQFPWGWGELESIAHRGTYDLDAHMRASGKDLRYFDEATKKHYTPVLIESSSGVDRTALVMLMDAYARERIEDPNGKTTERTVLRFHPKIAPVQVAVFSLARNKPELVERARAIEAVLRSEFRTEYDEGNIGQLYRRQDEIGTPFCVTVDYETLDDGAATLRHRDSMRQERVALDAVGGFLRERV